MANYMVFRAVVPPSFNLQEYSKHSSEPIRFDPVTVTEADSPQEAVNNVIAATGIITTGFAACEVDLIGFGSKSKIGPGGLLRSRSSKSESKQIDSGMSEEDRKEYERRIRELESDIDRINSL